MSCYLSTSCFKNYDLAEAIAKCGKLSNKNVEISAPHPYLSIDEIKKILLNFKKQNYNFTFHNYFPAPERSIVLNIASEDKKIINECNKMLNNLLNLTQFTKPNIYGIHAGYLSKAKPSKSGDFIFEEKSNNYEVSLNNATDFISKINNQFIKKNTYLLIENLFPSIARKSSLFCDIEEIKEFMSLVPSSVGLLLDLGHLNISSSILKFNRDYFIDEYLELFGDRLLEIHISENNGLKDEHLPIKKSSWQLEVIKKIYNLKSNLPIKKRVFCLESRNASEEELKISLDLINNLLA